MGTIFTEKSATVFWFPLLVNVLGGGFVAWLVKSRDQGTSSRPQSTGLTLEEVRRLIREEIDRIKGREPSPRPSGSGGSASRKDDDGWPVILAVGLMFLAIFYAKHQQIILDYSVFAATSLFGFFVASVLVSVLGGTLVGSAWIRYTLSVCVVSILAFPLLYLSIHPLYAPPGVENVQQLVGPIGMKGLTGLLLGGGEELIFLMLQVVGFIVLYGAWLMLLLSLVFMSSSALVAMGSKGRPLWLWFSIKTSRFGHPNTMTVLVTVLYIVSFLLISGLVNQWLKALAGG